MGKPLQGPDWTASEVVDGVRTIHCLSWNGFNDFITSQLLNFRSYIFRGHADESWCLEPTIDRLVRSSGKIDSTHLRKRHLEAFLYATRGRRGLNPQVLATDDEQWALGQHHGLATPLLDWTESPYVAAYFAFTSPGPKPGSPNRVVFALNRRSTEDKIRDQKIQAESAIRFVRPMNDDNNRLIAQRGLFTRAPDGVTVDDWISANFVGSTDGGKLLTIKIPSASRDVVLKSLDRMNVNHLSLFPDIYGAAKYTNISTLLGLNG